MRSKRLTAVALLIMALLLTGCGGRAVTDLYVQDIFDVIEGVEGALFTSSTLLVESPGEDYNDQLIELLQSNFRDAKNFKTVDEDFTTYISVDVKVPILTLETYDQMAEDEEAIGIVVVDMEDGSAAFGLALNSTKLDELFSAFAEQLWDSASIEDFTFGIKLYNDSKGPIFASLQGVYMDDVPVAYEEVYEVARREVVEIRLGDVARDYAYNEGIVVVGVVE